MNRLGAIFTPATEVAAHDAREARLRGNSRWPAGFPVRQRAIRSIGGPGETMALARFVRWTHTEKSDMTVRATAAELAKVSACHVRSLAGWLRLLTGWAVHSEEERCL